MCAVCDGYVKGFLSRAEAKAALYELTISDINEHPLEDIYKEILTYDAFLYGGSRHADESDDIN